MQRQYITIAVPSADIAEIKTIMDQWPITGSYEQVIDLNNPVWKKSGQDYHVISLDAERIDKKVVKDLAAWFAKEKTGGLKKVAMTEIVPDPTTKLTDENYILPVSDEVKHAK